MAPKKNENKTALIPKIHKEKKARVKKDSPKSKKQIIRVKLPLKKLKNDTKKNTSIVEDAKKMLTFDRMNEVARAQLVKDCPVEIEIAPQPVAKKRGRKMKIKDPDADVVPKKKPKGPPKVQKKVVKKSKVAVPKQNGPAVRRRGRPPGRGKLKAEDQSVTTSPSILSQGLPECKTPVKQTQIPNTTSADPSQNNTDSRRTSVASERSWTKDMSCSGSSTTTCVTVNSVTSMDIVRIDGKLPEIKLKKISIPDHVPKNETLETVSEKIENEHSLSEDSSSTSSSSSSSSSDSSTFENGLNLSTSSISPIPHSPTYTAANQSDRTTKPDLDTVSSTIEMLPPKLKSLDLSLPHINDESEYVFDMKRFEDKIFKILEEEHNTMIACNFLTQFLSEKCSIPVNKAPVSSSPQTKTEDETKPIEVPEFAKPDVTVIHNKNVCDNHESTNDLSFDCAQRRDTYDLNDDDDALSLFAESLTGMDSSRLSSAASVAYVPPVYEKYVPQPLTKRPPIAVYQPTKINEPATTNTNPRTKPVCEKQNADSTSIHKEQELEAVQPLANSILTAPKQTSNAVRGQPPLTISHYTAYRGKSKTLSGFCFFYQTSKCNKIICRYLHRIIDPAEVSKRLAQLSEDQFFYEYMLIAKWPVLKRRYVKCFVNECERRELPKILVEIVINYLANANPGSPEDATVIVDIVESALMYLNSWDLVVCEQLLTYKVGGKVLCDVFMEVLGNTQNFSRFKNVFINLAGFMVRVNRTFALEVVAHVLERVCILPYEPPLSAVLVSIIEKTDSVIFSNPMMSTFEMLLSNFNKALHERLLAIKEKNVTVVEPVPVSEPCPPALPSPCGSKELETALVQNGGPDERYTSPDTTNVDNVNKPAKDPVFIRTIKHLTKPPNLSKPPPGPRFRDWQHRSILEQIPRPIHRPKKRPMGPIERPQFKFQRRYGPEFYDTH